MVPKWAAKGGTAITILNQEGGQHNKLISFEGHLIWWSGTNAAKLSSFVMLRKTPGYPTWLHITYFYCWT